MLEERWENEGGKNHMKKIDFQPKESQYFEYADRRIPNILSIMGIVPVIVAVGVRPQGGGESALMQVSGRLQKTLAKLCCAVTVPNLQ